MGLLRLDVFTLSDAGVGDKNRERVLRQLDAEQSKFGLTGRRRTSTRLEHGCR